MGTHRRQALTLDWVPVYASVGLGCASILVVTIVLLYYCIIMDWHYAMVWYDTLHDELITHSSSHTTIVVYRV